MHNLVYMLSEWGELNTTDTNPSCQNALDIVSGFGHLMKCHENCVIGVSDKDMKKSSIFWDITPCSPLRVNRRFRGICRLHLQGRWKIKQETSMKQVASCYLLHIRLILRQWRWRRHVPPKRLMNFNRHPVLLDTIGFWRWCITQRYW
jgi:hypothetical protein